MAKHISIFETAKDLSLKDGMMVIVDKDSNVFVYRLESNRCSLTVISRSWENDKRSSPRFGELLLFLFMT